MLSLTPHDKAHRYLIMDRAYEGDKTRLLAINRGYIPVVPPKRNRKSPWEYSRELYKRRNTVERFFLRIKRFRKIFTRYDKLDIIFSGFTNKSTPVSRPGTQTLYEYSLVDNFSSIYAPVRYLRHE